MSVDVRSEAPTRASPERASAIILSAEALPRWFKGARVERVDAGWPGAGTRMSWRVYGSRFEATVAENALPARLVLSVATPSGTSRITNTFEARPGGGCSYAKRVEARLGKSGALGDWLTASFLKGSVRKEVARAAALADEAA